MSSKIRNLYKDNEFDSKLVKQIHQIIKTEMKGSVPRDFCWITLIPGQYNILDEGENVSPPTFTQLKKVGLLMEIYYHPNPAFGLLLLPSLQAVFLLAKPTSSSGYHTDGTIFGTHLAVQVKEVSVEVWNFRLGTRWPTRRFDLGVWTKSKAGKEDEIRLWFRLARSKKGETKFNISGERSDEKVDILYVCTKSKHIAYYLKHHDNRDGIDWIKLINEYPDLATHDNNFKGWLQNLHDINILEANSERLWGQKIFKYLVTPAKHLDTCGIMLGCVRSDSSNSLAIGEISIKLPNLTERSIIESLLQIGQLYYDNIYNVVSLKRADGQVIQWIGSLSDNLCFSANSLVFGKFLENDTISELSIE